MAITWFIFVFCCLLSNAAVFGCPEECECNSQTDSVTCNLRQKSGLSSPIPTSTVNLELICHDAGDSQTSIRPESRLFSSLLQLKSLTVVRCFKEELAVETFSGLDSLKFLIITQCQLKSLAPGMFNGMPELEALNLTKNEIAEIQPKTFVGLGKKIQYISISDNRLEKIDISALEGVNTENTAVELSGNPFICDCHLERVWDKFMVAHTNNLNMKCAENNELTGTSWQSLDSEKLNNTCAALRTTPKTTEKTKTDRTKDKDKTSFWIRLALAGLFVILVIVFGYCVIRCGKKTKKAKKKKKEKSRSESTSDSSENSKTSSVSESDSESKPLLSDSESK